MRKQEVSQLSGCFLLSALHFNPYTEILLWKVWLLSQKKNKMFKASQNRENLQPANELNVCVTSRNWLWEYFFFFHITYVGWKKQKLNPIRSSSLSAQMNFFGCSGWISTNRGELKRNRCLQHSAWLSCCCATDVHTIYLCFLCQLVVLHFQHPAHEGCHEWLTLLFNSCFIYSERNPLLVTKKKKMNRGSKTCFKITFIKSNMLCFCCLMRLLGVKNTEMAV